MTERTLADLAKEAIAVQNASNILGVARSFSEAVLELRRLMPQAGSDAIAKHPITRLWASKIHDLAGMGLSDMERYSDANTACGLLTEL